jgi:hypothetical protein
MFIPNFTKIRLQIRKLTLIYRYREAHTDNMVISKHNFSLKKGKLNKNP